MLSADRALDQMLTGSRDSEGQKYADSHGTIAAGSLVCLQNELPSQNQSWKRLRVLMGAGIVALKSETQIQK